MVKQPLICPSHVSAMTENSTLLQTVYADRYIQAKGLFEKLDTQMFSDICNIAGEPARLTEWHDQDLPNKIYSYRHEGPVIGYDEDIMVGPHDWENENNPIGDYVVRKKCYLYDWTGEKLSGISTELRSVLSELLYFVDMHADFLPVLDAGKAQYDTQDVKKFLHKLMVIEYSTPTATPDTVTAHREHNTQRFGPEHCDETLAGLHLGENYQEFQTQDANGNWNYHPGLSGSDMLWMHGEHSIASGFSPTYHRMIHNPDNWLGTRYSIIFDLQVRYD